MTMNRVSILSLYVLGTFSITGCSTVDSTIDGLSNMEMPTLFSSKGTDKETGETEQIQPVVPDNCPSATLVKDLAFITQFEEGATPSDSSKVSAVDISRLNSSCVYKDGSVDVELYITFDGSIGPKGRMRPTDEAFFSYPYFVAVTNDSNEIISKDVFALSFSYEKNQIEQSYSEKITQTIPVETEDDGENYNVLIGFQLTQDELAYNREQLMEKAAEKETIADPAAQTQDDMAGETESE